MVSCDCQLCLVSVMRCLVSVIWCLVSVMWCLVSFMWYLEVVDNLRLIRICVRRLYKSMLTAYISSELCIIDTFITNLYL